MALQNFSLEQLLQLVGQVDLFGGPGSRFAKV